MEAHQTSKLHVNPPKGAEMILENGWTPGRLAIGVVAVFVFASCFPAHAQPDRLFSAPDAYEVTVLLTQGDAQRSVLVDGAIIEGSVYSNALSTNGNRPPWVKTEDPRLGSLIFAPRGGGRYSARFVFSPSDPTPQFDLLLSGCKSVTPPDGKEACKVVRAIAAQAHLACLYLRQPLLISACEVGVAYAQSSCNLQTLCDVFTKFASLVHPPSVDIFLSISVPGGERLSREFRNVTLQSSMVLEVLLPCGSVDNAACCGGSPIPLGLTCCSGLQVDLMADNNNCGACGKVCKAGEKCVNYQCQAPPSGITGTWQGTYRYGSDCSHFTGIETLVLTDTNGIISGTLTDVVISPVTGFDSGTLHGTYNGTILSFTSFYDSGARGTFTGIVAGNTIVGRITGICGSGADVTFTKQVPE